ncbi:MAG: class I SAM-dependent methyltransferase [Acidobacteriota bacterium]
MSRAAVVDISCRGCGAGGLEMVLSLGRTPLANSLLTAEQLKEPQDTYPLDLVFCPACTLVQITETVPPEKLFREYLYFSSFSDTMLAHARTLAERVIKARSLNDQSLVIEIASNDGYLLQFYKGSGIDVLGIEPARNIARVAREQRGIPTLSEFFGEDLAAELKTNGQRADVIHAHNVMAHVADLNGFVRGLQALLKDSGVAIIEVPYVKDMIDGSEFDTIYHEHLCYFSLTSLSHLFERHGLRIEEVERLAIHGGSLRVFVSKRTQEQPAASSSVDQMLAEERNWGIGRIEFYQGFGARVERLRNQLVQMLSELKSRGKGIAAYGASAKGSTLLNYFGIGREMLDFIADRSTVKQGLFMPGTKLPIYAPEKLVEKMPDYVLLLTWNFAEEILDQQAEYRRRGGHFIIPIPEVAVV